MNWPLVPLLDAISDVSSGNTKIAQRDYLAHGQLPIIDQGSDFIGGYTDDESARHSAPGSVIIFGDHTKIFKFVNFPFAMGADGVKVLAIKDGWDARFVFHFLRSITLPDVGYSRHFKFLKTETIPSVPLSEQRRIAAILDRAQDQLDSTQKAKSLLGTLPRSIFDKMFGERTANIVQLGELIADHQLGLDKRSSELGPDGTHSYLKMDSITRTGDLDLTRLTRADCSEEEVEKFALRDGDFIFNTRNAKNLVGKSTVYRGPSTLFNNNILRLRFSDNVHPDFIHHFLWSEPGRQQLNVRKSGTTSVWAIYLKSLKTISVPVPDFEEQLLFAQRLETVRRRAHDYRQLELSLEELFESLRFRAFRGEL